MAEELATQEDADNVLDAMLLKPFEVQVTADQAKALEKAIVKSKVLGSSMLHGDHEIAKLLADLYKQIEERADKTLKLLNFLEGGPTWTKSDD